MFEVIFLMVLAGIWIAAASYQDLKIREVPNWLNFSLIIFALGFRFFWSLFEAGNFTFFYQGLIGFGVFLVLGNLFYYARMFAGGDAKLMIALGAILPWSSSLGVNLRIFVVWFFLFLFVGMVYGLAWSLALMQESSCGLKIDSGSSYGVMQINRIHNGSYGLPADRDETVKILLENPEENLRVGVAILKAGYRTTPRQFKNACTAEYKEKFYTEWEAAVRGYNGWGCGKDSDGNPIIAQDKYVKNVFDKVKELKDCLEDESKC